MPIIYKEAPTPYPRIRTVAELIEKLKEYPPEWNIVFCNDYEHLDEMTRIGEVMPAELTFDEFGDLVVKADGLHDDWESNNAVVLVHQL